MSILIVDDSADDRFFLEYMLKEAGYTEVVSVESAPEAFRKLGLEHPGSLPSEVDVILLDVMLPGISGTEACRRIKSCQELADTPVIMVTGRTDLTSLKEAFEAGAMDYIAKPADEVELTARIRSAIRLKQEMDKVKAHEREMHKLLQALTEDLEEARKMQCSLLPDPAVALKGVRAAWRFEPCDRLGGDLLNVFPLDDSHTGFFILDVSGHGVKAALLSVTLSQLLTYRASGSELVTDDSGRLRTPADVTKILNERFQTNLDKCQFFTMIYGIFNSSDGTVCYTNAGHPPLLECAPDGSVTVWSMGNYPVGLVDHVQYELDTRKVQPGTRLFLISDGILEAKNTDGERSFDIEKMSDLVRVGRTLDLESCASSVMETFHSWIGDEKPGDDITLLSLEITQMEGAKSS